MKQRNISLLVRKLEILLWVRLDKGENCSLDGPGNDKILPTLLVVRNCLEEGDVTCSPSPRSEDEPEHMRWQEDDAALPQVLYSAFPTLESKRYSICACS